MKTKLIALFTLLFGMTSLWGASGDSERSAVSISSSKSITLVEDAEYGGGAYYLKFTIKRGNAYSVWISGDDAAELDVSVSQGFDDESSLPFFGASEEKDGGKTKVCYLYAEDWNIDEDPEISDAASGTMYICVSYMGGDDENWGIGKRCNVFVSQGIRSFYVEGEETTPRRIQMTTGIQPEIKNLFEAGDYESEYYYTMHLEKGKKYRLWAVGSPDAVTLDSVDLAALGYKNDVAFKDAELRKAVFGYDVADTNGVGYVLYPNVTRDYVVKVSSAGNPGMTFGIAYMAFRTLLPAEHANVVLLDESTGYSAEVMPGRKASDGLYTYDEVIDETLCRIYLKKGERWYFETNGATNDLYMATYDENGTILATNYGKGNGDKNVRAVINAASDGWYYVGVCKNAGLDTETDIWTDPDTNCKVTITAVNADDSAYAFDDYDESDSVYTGASQIQTYPRASTNNVIGAGSVHGTHTLNGKDWYDWFSFAAHQSVTYQLKASFVSDIDKANTNLNLSLKAKVYKIVNGAITELTPDGDYSGSVTPDHDGVTTRPLTFTAAENALYYVELSVAEGLGLDFPEYQLHAMGHADGYDLGLVKVVSEGPDATWSVYQGNGTQFPSGSSLIMLANAQNGILFNAVPGYKPQAAAGGEYVTLPEWSSEDDTVVLKARYIDANDPSDDTIAGYHMIAPSATEQVLSRTLWVDDPADMIVFKAEAGVYYNFEINDTTAGCLDGSTESGDAVFSVYSQNDLDNPIVADVTELKKQVFEGGLLYLVKVHHETAEAKDSCYDFVFTSARVGEVGFLAEKINVGKNDPYVDLQVLRTASEGMVRLNYATVAGTAKPGEDYFPTSASSVLVWEDGDMSTRTIRIPLIPNENDIWESNKCFTVKLWPMPEDVCLENEYIAALSTLDGRTGTAEITILPAAEMNPGIVTVLDQPLMVTEGNELRVRLERTGGANGKIAVSAITGGGSAVEGSDYIKIYEPVVWEDGESGVKEVTLKTMNSGSSGSKTVDIAFGALKADYTAIGFGDYRDCLIPSLSTSSARVTILGRYAESTTGLITGSAANNVSLGAPFGSWYADETGVLQCAPVAAGGFSRVQFTVDGPGFFVAEPQIIGGAGDALMRYLIGNGPITECSAGERLVLPVTGGKQTIIFQLDSVSGGAQACFPLQDNGMPYKWIPLSSIVPTEPANAQIVPYGHDTLGWTVPCGVTGESIWYRVKLGLSNMNTPYEIVSPDVTNCVKIADVWLDQIKALVSTKAPGSKQQLWWRVECAYSDANDPDFSQLEWLAAPECWNFELLSPGSTATQVTGTDATGKDIQDGMPVELVQGVYFECDINTTANSATLAGVLAGALPPGLKVEGLKIKGVPSVEGEYEAVLGTLAGEQWVATTTLGFEVSSMGSAAGTFCGLCKEVGNAADLAWLRAGSLVVTVSAGGAISARMNFGAGAMTFTSADGFDEVLEADDLDNKTGERLFRSRIEMPTILQGLPFVNAIDLEVTGLDLEDPASFEKISGKARITINLLDSYAVPAEYTYECDLVRSSSDNELFVEAVRPFAGYYTVSLAPIGPRAGEAAGNGILTLTVNENGSTVMTGTLADGTAFACSAWSCLAGDRLRVPVFACAANYSFGGVLELFFDANGVPVVDSLGECFWSKDGVGSTVDAAGFTLAVTPVGGWYDSAVNLRRYYLDRDFSVNLEPLTGMSAELLPADCDYTFDTLPRDVAVSLWGDNLETPATSYAIESGRYDLARSINPWGVKLAFSKGSGVVTGTFSAISDGDDQKIIGTCNHKGVLLMNRDEARSPLDTDVWTAGFYLLKSTSDWSLSMPFNIKATKVDRDWSEAEIPVTE